MLRVDMQRASRSPEDDPLNEPSRRAILRSLFGALAGLGIAGCRPSQLPRSTGHPLVSRPAPRFQRTALSMREVGIPATGRTRVTIIDFWASWCEACKDTMPVLDSLWQGKRRDGMMVIGVSVDATDDDAAAAARQLGASFPIVVDPGLAGMYSVGRIPLTFVVDKNDTVRWVGRDPSSIEQAALYLLHEG
jgi:thiol-disulfide isomerase/thioredoxin